MEDLKPLNTQVAGHQDNQGNGCSLVVVGSLPVWYSVEHRRRSTQKLGGG